MPTAQSTPTEAVKVVARRPGPKPKKLRYAAAIQQAEDTLAGKLPQLINAALELALTPGEHQPKSLQYCMNRILGMPAKLEKAPADDGGLPADASNAATIEQMAIAGLTDAGLAAVKAAITADLKAQGKLTDGAEVELNGTEPT